MNIINCSNREGTYDQPITKLLETDSKLASKCLGSYAYVLLAVVFMRLVEVVLVLGMPPAGVIMIIIEAIMGPFLGFKSL